MTPHQRQPSTDYLPTLDGWRAIAIGLVLLCHGFESALGFLTLSPAVYAETIKDLGLLGVQIFFGLSGLLITTKLIQEERSAGGVSLLAFYWRRAFRILPASLFFLVIVGFLTWQGFLKISMERWLSTLLFAANYTHAEHSWYLGHFWSLAVEEHFYFIWPVIFVCLKSGNQRLTMAIIFILLIAIWRMLDFRFQIVGDVPAKFWGRTDIAADGILCGVMMALIHQHERLQPYLIRFLKHALTWPFLLLALICLQFTSGLHWTLAFGLLSIKALLIPLLILTTLQQSSSLKGKILESSLFRYIGRLSYSLYLWQQLFLVWDDHRVPSLSFVQSFPANLLALFICANLSLMWIEKPMIAWSRNFLKR